MAKKAKIRKAVYAIYAALACGFCFNVFGIWQWQEYLNLEELENVQMRRLKRAESEDYADESQEAPKKFAPPKPNMVDQVPFDESNRKRGILDDPIKAIQSIFEFDAYEKPVDGLDAIANEFNDVIDSREILAAIENEGDADYPQFQGGMDVIPGGRAGGEKGLLPNQPQTYRKYYVHGQERQKKAKQDKVKCFRYGYYGEQFRVNVSMFMLAEHIHKNPWYEWKLKKEEIFANSFAYPRRFTKLPSREKSHFQPCDQYFIDSIRSYRVFPNILWNQYKKRKIKGDITLVTQMGADRMDKLEKLGEMWPGPISAAIYVNEACLKDFMTDLPSMKLAKRRNAFIHIALADGEYYPVNFLRNLALNQSQSTFVFLSDVDFIPGYDTYQNYLKYLYLLPRGAKRALIAPGLEMKVDHPYPRSKRDLVQLMDNGTVIGFHMDFFVHGHKPTNFNKWKKTDKAYLIRWQNKFEPYYVMRRSDTPQYPEEMIGRYYNKVAHCYSIARMGFKLIVLPNVYTIHLPHPTTNTKALKSKVNKWCVSKVFDYFQSDENWWPRAFNRTTFMNEGMIDE